MALDLSSVFGDINTILSGLFSKYVALKLIGLNQQQDNQPYYLLDGEAITAGFRYLPKKLPVTGEVIETLKLVPQSDEVKNILSSAKLKQIELIDADGNFMRFTMKTTLKEPNPPDYEWIFLIVPNKQEKTVIT